jgi:hypothetical protein
MRMLAYLLAIICAIVAVVYFLVPAGSLPRQFPGFVYLVLPLDWIPSTGYEAGSAHIHAKHAIIAAIAAVVLFLIGWVAGRARA